MDITHEKKGDITILAITGRLDAASAPAADKAINALLEEENCSRMLMNLEDLEYLSSGGLRVILATAKQLKRRQGELVLCALADYVKEIFEISGFDALIPIVDTVDTGIQQLQTG